MTPDPETQEQNESESEPEMCCDGSGRTAEEHRRESSDGKCCVD